MHNAISSIHLWNCDFNEVSYLVGGMDEVRATLSHVVTLDDLRTLHQEQTAELQTYVQAELAPVHSGMA